ncbi:MAG TPA: hypothetical protein VHO28_08440 [Ignavibacteriales bacterium]|nr:hypothetical protein [Ignavibacteriales bacterium]
MYFLIGIWGGPRKEYAAMKETKAVNKTIGTLKPSMPKK